MKHFALVLTLSLATAAFAGDDVIRRGASISADAKAVPLETVLGAPGQYGKDAIVVEGVITQACSNKGCWMELTPAAGKSGVRVTFKDYAFFIPLDSKGMSARAEGVTRIKTLSKKDADHLEGEGAKLTRNADGTAKEVSFVANGVELRPAGE